MTRRATLLIAAAVILAAAAVIIVLSPVRPLLRSSAAQVIYSVDEDFKENGTVFRPLFGRDVYYLYLPEVQGSYRWWIVDFVNRAIYSPHPPRTLLAIPTIPRHEPLGVSIADQGKMGAWQWTFTGSRASFAGSDVVCAVQVSD